MGAGAFEARVRGVAEWLGPRLGMAMDLVGGPWPVVADVACDHARLSLALLASGRAERVLASDVAPEALAQGIRRIHAMLLREDAVGAAWQAVLGLSGPPSLPEPWPTKVGEQVAWGPLRWRVASGLGHLAPEGVQAIALCGIGGKLAVRLLNQGLKDWGLAGVQRVVVLPHRDPLDVLAWGEASGWALVDRAEVLSKGRRYQGFAFQPPGSPS